MVQVWPKDIYIFLQLFSTHDFAVNLPELAWRAAPPCAAPGRPSRWRWRSCAAGCSPSCRVAPPVLWQTAEGQTEQLWTFSSISVASIFKNLMLIKHFWQVTLVFLLRLFINYFKNCHNWNKTAFYFTKLTSLFRCAELRE